MAIAALVVGALIATGCGGDDSSSASAGTITVETGSLSKAEFIKQGDAVCTDSQNKLQLELSQFLKTNSQPKTPAGQNVMISEFANEVLVPNYEKRIDELSALGAPDADGAEVAKILDSLQQRLDQIRERPAQLSGDTSLFSQPVKLATAYGLKGCAETFGS